MAFGRRRAPERRGTPADLLLVGLGNPGPKYAGTRHNVGYDVVDLLVVRHGGRLRPVKGVPVLADELRVDGARLAAIQPTTYMNLSGEAVAPMTRRFGIDEPTRLVVAHDEMDLPVGRLKVKVGGGFAGHNGLKSIGRHCHTAEFVRLRIGVGKPVDPDRGADHVLRSVPRAEREVLDAVVVHAADAAELILAEGPEAAMDRFNGLVVQ